MRNPIRQTMQQRLGASPWWERAVLSARRASAAARKSDRAPTAVQVEQPARPPVVGIFGKHPAWPDHIALPLPSAALAEFRAQLYDGIRQVISHDAWGKRAAGATIPFGHRFCAAGLSDEGGWLIGRIWESADAVGRREYPMVAAAHVFGVNCDIAMAVAATALDQLMETCRNTADKAQVLAALEAAGGQLADRARELAPPQESPVAAAVKRNDPAMAAAVSWEWVMEAARFCAAQVRRLKFRGRPNRPKGVRLSSRDSSPEQALCHWAAAAQRRSQGRVAVFAVCPDSDAWVDVVVSGVTPRAVERLRLAESRAFSANSYPTSVSS